MIHATVTLGTARHVATESAPVTFGRATECTICLDPRDIGISRRAGTVLWENESWWLKNLSRTRPLIVADAQIPRNVLPRQRRHPIDLVTRVIIDGRDGQHILTVTPHRAIDDEPSAGDEPAGLNTVFGRDAKITDKDRQALAALFEDFLINPSRIENIRSYEDAAQRIGNWHTRDQVRRRVENLRKRLFTAGVRELTGPNAMQHLAEYVIASGLLSFDDVRSLLPPRSHHG